MNITDDEALDFMDRLPEWLRQADLTNFGSHIEVVYVAPGAQHVDKQYIASPPSPLQKARGVDSSEMSKSLPDELTTDEAMILWRKAQQAGYINEHYQPTGSRPEAAILAYEMARILGIEDKWKSFETLWNRRNMYRDYHTAINQKKSLKFRDKVRDALT